MESKGKLSLVDWFTSGQGLHSIPAVYESLFWQVDMDLNLLRCVAALQGNSPQLDKSAQSGISDSDAESSTSSDSESSAAIPADALPAASDSEAVDLDLDGQIQKPSQQSLDKVGHSSIQI